MRVQQTFRHHGVYKAFVAAYDWPHRYWYIFDTTEPLLAGR